MELAQKNISFAHVQLGSIKLEFKRRLVISNLPDSSI